MIIGVVAARADLRKHLWVLREALSSDALNSGASGRGPDDLPARFGGNRVSSRPGRWPALVASATPCTRTQRCLRESKRGDDAYNPRALSLLLCALSVPDGRTQPGGEPCFAAMLEGEKADIISSSNFHHRQRRDVGQNSGHPGSRKAPASWTSACSTTTKPSRLPMGCRKSSASSASPTRSTLSAGLNGRMNNRDHRKLTDHRQPTARRQPGRQSTSASRTTRPLLRHARQRQAVWSMTAIFAFWGYVDRSAGTSVFRPRDAPSRPTALQPFVTAPLDHENVGASMYRASFAPHGAMSG